MGKNSKRLMKRHPVLPSKTQNSIVRSSALTQASYKKRGRPRK